MKDQAATDICENDKTGKEADKKVPGSHPTYIAMVLDAIVALKDTKKKYGHLEGVFFNTITSFITTNYQVGSDNKFVNKYRYSMAVWLVHAKQISTHMQPGIGHPQESRRNPRPALPA